jgi:hypothetical protein
MEGTWLSANSYPQGSKDFGIPTQLSNRMHSMKLIGLQVFIPTKYSQDPLKSCSKVSSQGRNVGLQFIYLCKEDSLVKSSI